MFLILMNFMSSFIYAYYSTFMENLSEEALQSFKYFDIFFQTIFTFHMVLQVFVEYQIPFTHKVETDLKKLVMIYIRGEHFIYDLITVIPYHSIVKGFLSLKYYRLFYLIKVIRIFSGL
jgi:hypothetical protein